MSDDAKAAAASAECPEEFRVLARSHAQATPVCEHEVSAHQVIAGETVSAHEPAGAAAERETADTGRRDQPPGRRQTGRSGRGIDIAPKRAAFDRRDSHLSIDADIAHPAHVQQQGSILDGEPGNVVAAPAHRDSNMVIARDLQSELDIVRVRAACDRTRPAVNRCIPDAPQFVEFISFGADDGAA
jgi:hypothetical protein